MGLIYGLKVNISVAIVAMVNHTAIGLSQQIIRLLNLLFLSENIVI